MRWSIAKARQHFSELLQEAAREPQEVCNRDRPVAAVIDLETFRRFCQWEESQAEAPVARAFTELRGICAEENYTFETPAREDRTSGWEEELESCLVDTNVLSELAKPAPDAGVLSWVGTVARLALSVVTVDEVYFCLSWRPNARVEAWFDGLSSAPLPRVVRHRGDRAASGSSEGRPAPQGACPYPGRRADRRHRPGPR